MAAILNYIDIEEVEEQVIVTMQSKRISENLVFVGCLENKSGVLYVGKGYNKLEIKFEWNLQTSNIIETMIQFKDNHFVLLDLIQVLTWYSYL